MNTTTGNLYLQVYNAPSNKYIEIPSNVGTISFLTTPTGFTSYATTSNFSGFYFSRPVKINKAIEMLPINIGANNTTGNVTYSINIGAGNNDIFTRSSYINAQAVSATNLGILNGSIDSTYSTNLGSYNSFENAQSSLNLGLDNSISGSFKGLNLGFSNSITTGDYNLIFGFNNSINSGLNILLIGTDNTQLAVIENSNILGNFNTAQNVNFLNSFGFSNIFSNLDNSFNLGNSNKYYDSNNITMLNNSNTISGSSSEIILGNSNTLINSSADLIIGSNNITNFTTGNNINGSNNNLINGNSNNIYASQNSISNSNSNYIFGLSNAASGLSNSIVLGLYNSLDQSIINQLYRIELTGITGKAAGQTPFTGITGYRMVKYIGVPGSGGNNNFIAGQFNSTSLNYNSYIIGENNQVLNNANSYIFGTNNYLEENNSSFAFGANNSISGFQNYVIGNNNSVRSGDYNSILIGISHQFTGADKVSSINIASVDSSIEVSPGDIKFNSPNRPKINNEDITIKSDLNEYTKKSEIIQNSGIFDSLKFYDPNYNRLADQVELQTFTYSGKENRYFGAFSGKNSNYDTIYFNGFFREQPISYYTGAFVVQGNKYYWSNDLNYNIIFSNTMTSSGSWMLTSSHNFDTFFYNKSTNTGVFPMTNWIKTGYNIAGLGGLSKGTGITITNFTFDNVIDGVFARETLNASQNLVLKSFNIFGTSAYTSNQGMSVIYGNHTNPKFTPTWLVVDNFSSGVYYRNDNYSSTQTPQSGWVVTGFLGYTGQDPYMPTPFLNGTYGMKLSMGSRQAVIRSSDPTLGTVYIPIYY
jgi:hypothetical protein